MNQYEDHPIAGIFPMLPQDKLNDLADDIAKHGLKLDITLFEDQILDGRNRYRACLQAGVNPTFVVYAGDDPVGHVLSLNQHRRHLTPSQLAGIAAAAMPHFQAEAKKRQVRKPRSVPAIVPEQKFDARAAAAAAVGVSPRYVSDACRLKEQDPEMFEKVKAGEITLPKAIQELREKAPEPTPPPKKIVVVLSEGRRIWDVAKAKLNQIDRDDSQRVEVLEEIVAYAQRRLEEGQ